MALQTKELKNLSSKGIKISFLSRYDKQVLSQVSRVKESAALEATLITIKENEELSLQIEQEGSICDLTLAFDELRDEVTHEVEDGWIKREPLYQYANNEDFPWPNGKYVYEITIDGVLYYALLQVLAKNITEDEFTDMHLYLESKLENVSVNRDESAVMMDHDHLAQMKQAEMSKWLEENMNALMSILRMMERNHATTFRHVYEIEHVPKHMDRRSIKWENSYKGAIYQGQRYLNRKYRATNNTAENQFVKMKILKVIRILQAELSRLLVEKEAVDKELADLVYEKTVRREVLERAKASDRAHAVDINQRQIQIANLKREKANLDLLQEQVNDKLTLFHDSIIKLNNMVNNPFWQKISNVPQRMQMKAMNKNEMAFHKIMAKLQAIKAMDDRDKDQLAMHHLLYPTAVLYEYYIYFLLIDILEGFGFVQVAMKNVGESRSNLFGMQANTTFVLEREDKQVHLVYEQAVDYDSAFAIEKERYFYSRSKHDRPDIRLDYYQYDAELEEHIFQSSIIVEVKYRPFSNIFSRESFTKEMRQLTEYRAIEYYCPYRRRYQRNVVKEVYCVYPGDVEHRSENLEPATYVSLRPSTEADFMQFMQGEMQAWLEEC